jgi:hypothetical protein
MVDIYDVESCWGYAVHEVKSRVVARYSLSHEVVS